LRQAKADLQAVLQTEMIKEFLEGLQPNIFGKTISEIYTYTDQQIESEHTFIQWLFPLDEPSRNVRNSPVLGPDEIALIMESPTAQSILKKSADWYLGFLSRNSHWIKRYDHNHLRITRVIKSLRLLAGDATADKFKEDILRLLGTNKTIIPRETKEFWDLA
jgi:hypothetical protein